MKVHEAREPDENQAARVLAALAQPLFCVVLRNSDHHPREYNPSWCDFRRKFTDIYSEILRSIKQRQTKTNRFDKTRLTALGSCRPVPWWSSTASRASRSCAELRRRAPWSSSMYHPQRPLDGPLLKILPKLVFRCISADACDRITNLECFSSFFFLSMLRRNGKRVWYEERKLKTPVYYGERQKSSPFCPTLFDFSYTSLWKSHLIFWETRGVHKEKKRKS